ncbi:hypothetical protein BDD12DRAFT_909151 [Trichophaea hybrida]|nr:hypothetical protein BDD12DRAFT_909151 [Trichophaea hybrida]
MPKVIWTPENDRKLLIRLIERSAKAYDTVELAKLFHGATAKAIEERIAKLKREAKASSNVAAPEKDMDKDKGKKRKREATGRAGGGGGRKKGRNGKVNEEEMEDDEEVGVKGEGEA